MFIAVIEAGCWDTSIVLNDMTCTYMYVILKRFKCHFPSNLGLPVEEAPINELHEILKEGQTNMKIIKI